MKISKKVLIISGSPRVKGNSDVLCEQFAKGAKEAGHEVEKINLREKQIHFCQACYACKKTGLCVQQDSMTDILVRMIQADVIVLATPVYFYSLAGQMKTLIDRSYAGARNLVDKEFYFIVTVACDKAGMRRTVESLEGFTDCLPNATVRDIIYGAGAWQLGEVYENPAFQEAYQAGLDI